MRTIVELFLFVTYLTISNAQSDEIASHIDNYWQRRVNMELSQDRYQPASFEQSAPQLARRNEYALPELPALPSIEMPPLPHIEQPPFPPFPSLEQPPAPVFQQPPLPPFPPFEQPPAPIFEQQPQLEESETPHLDMSIKHDDVNRRQNIYDPSFHLSRRQGNLAPFQPYGLNRRHNTYGAGMSSGKEMTNRYPPKHYPSMQYPSNSQCNRLSSPNNYPVHPPVLSPCEALCGTQKNGYQTPMFSQHATGSTHGMSPMGRAVA